jgi:O-antigen/teichoic acid export membrane protein
MGELATPSMSERTVRDTGKLFGAQLLVGVCAVFFSAWLNRLLSPAELALWPMCVGLGGLIAALSSAGMGDTFVRLVPGLIAQGKDDEARRILRTGVLVNVLLAVVVAGLLYAFADPVARLLLHDEASVPLVRPMLLAAVFIALRDRLAWALRATQRFGKQALISVVVDVARTPLAVALFFAFGSDVRGVICALTIIPIVACALTLYWTRDYLGGRGLHPPLKLLRFSLPFYCSSILAFTSDRMSYLLIGLLATPEALAVYFVADSIVAYAQALSAFASGALAPKLSEKTARESRESASRVFTRCTRYAFLGLLPLHVLIAVLARPMMRLYGGSQYEHQGYVLSLLCGALLLEAIYGLQYTYVQILSNPWKLVLLNSAQGAAAISALLLLVPTYAATGAALARVCVAGLLIALSARAIGPAVPLRYDLRALGLALAASLTAGAVAALALLPGWHHAVTIVAGGLAGAVAYGSCMVRRLDKGDVDLLTQIAPRWALGAPLRARLHGRLCALLVRHAQPACGGGSGPE